MKHSPRSVPSPSKLPLIATNDASPDSRFSISNCYAHRSRRGYSAEGPTARGASGGKTAVLCIQSIPNDVIVGLERLTEYRISLAKNNLVLLDADHLNPLRHTNPKEKAKMHCITIPYTMLAHSSSHAPRLPSLPTSSPPQTLTPSSRAFRATPDILPRSPPLQREIDPSTK